VPGRKRFSYIIGVGSKEEALVAYQDRVTRAAEAAKQTTGVVLPRGGDTRSEDAQSIADSAISSSQKDRAKENEISLASQKKRESKAAAQGGSITLSDLVPADHSTGIDGRLVCILPAGEAPSMAQPVFCLTCCTPLEPEQNHPSFFFQSNLPPRQNTDCATCGTKGSKRDSGKGREE